MTVDITKIAIKEEEDKTFTVTIPNKSEIPPPLTLSESDLDRKIAGVENQIAIAQARLTELQTWKTKVDSLKP